jgi:hypothetical protein
MRRSKTSSLIRNARGRGATVRSSDQEVMLHLSRSQIFKDYKRAFYDDEGALPLVERMLRSPLLELPEE